MRPETESTSSWILVGLKPLSHSENFFCLTSCYVWPWIDFFQVADHFLQTFLYQTKQNKKYVSRTPGSGQSQPRAPVLHHCWILSNSREDIAIDLALGLQIITWSINLFPHCHISLLRWLLYIYCGYLSLFPVLKYYMAFENFFVCHTPRSPLFNMSEFSSFYFFKDFDFNFINNGLFHIIFFLLTTFIFLLNRFLCVLIHLSNCFKQLYNII